MRIVHHNINGGGVGHLTRGVAIARNIRNLTAARGIRAEIFFLTTSEAGGLLFAESFPAFKMPSREILNQSGIAIHDFAATALKWTRCVLELLEPDLIIVDTFPAGCYDELPQNLSLCKKKVIIHRPVHFANLDKDIFYRSLSLYDSIIVPETSETSPHDLPTELAGRAEHFGPVLSREPTELLSRLESRSRLGIDAGQSVVYLTAGGGGDDGARRQLQDVYEAVRTLERIRFVIGAGALYRGERILAPNVTWLANENAFELMPGFDAAISAAGYNSFNELMFAGVPTIFLPQKKWADDQLSRAERAHMAGAASVFETTPSANILRDTLLGWLDAGKNQAGRTAAKNLVPRNYAADIAEHVINLLQ